MRCRVFSMRPCSCTHAPFACRFSDSTLPWHAASSACAACWGRMEQRTGRGGAQNSRRRESRLCFHMRAPQTAHLAGRAVAQALLLAGQALARVDQRQARRAELLLQLLHVASGRGLGALVRGQVLISHRQALLDKGQLLLRHHQLVLCGRRGRERGRKGGRLAAVGATTADGGGSTGRPGFLTGHGALTGHCGHCVVHFWERPLSASAALLSSTSSALHSATARDRSASWSDRFSNSAAVGQAALAPVAAMASQSANTSKSVVPALPRRSRIALGTPSDAGNAPRCQGSDGSSGCSPLVEGAARPAASSPSGGSRPRPQTAFFPAALACAWQLSAVLQDSTSAAALPEHQ